MFWAVNHWKTYYNRFFSSLSIVMNLKSDFTPSGWGLLHEESKGREKPKIL